MKSDYNSSTDPEVIEEQDVLSIAIVTVTSDVSRITVSDVIALVTEPVPYIFTLT